MNDVAWHLEVVKPEHNHEASLSGAHPAHRRIALIEHKEEISRQLTVQTKQANVLSSLRIRAPTPNSVRWDENGNPEVVNPMFISRDIYNFRAQLRRNALGSLTPIQSLIQEFDKSDWVYELQTNDENQVSLTRTGQLKLQTNDENQSDRQSFFSKCSTQTLLKANPEFLVMDCTYKTNRFKMPLLIIGGQAALHTTFYVAFCFMHEKTNESYIWAMTRLKVLYSQLELPSPTTTVTDMDRGLMSAIELIFHLSVIYCVSGTSTRMS